MLPPDPAPVAATPTGCSIRSGWSSAGPTRWPASPLWRTRWRPARTPSTATGRLVAVPGIGAWTAAEVVRVGYGDPDAVSVGDYHIPTWSPGTWPARAGPGPGRARRAGCSPADERMLELLEPFRRPPGPGLRAAGAGGQGAPRFGPRMPIRSFAAYWILVDALDHVAGPPVASIMTLTS